MLQVPDLRAVVDAASGLFQRVEFIQGSDHDKAVRQSIAVTLQTPGGQWPRGDGQRLMAALQSIHVVSENFGATYPGGIGPAWVDENWQGR